MKPVLVSLLIFLVCPSLGFAEPGLLAEEPAADSSMHIKIERLKEEIYSINLINILDLTSNQIDFILDRSNLARPIITVYRDMEPEIYEAQATAYAEFKAEDELNAGFSPQVESNTVRAERLGKDTQEKVALRLNRIAEPVYGIFTDRQFEIITSYKPVLFPKAIQDKEIARKSSMSWRIETIEETLLEAVDMSGGRYKAMREKLGERLVNAFPPYRIGSGGKKKAKGDKASKRDKKKEMAPYMFESREEAIERLCEAMDMLRESPVEIAEGKVEEFINKRIFPSRVQQIESEIRKISRSKHPHKNPVARYLFNLEVVSYLEKLKVRRPKGDRVGVR